MREQCAVAEHLAFAIQVKVGKKSSQVNRWGYFRRF